VNAWWIFAGAIAGLWLIVAMLQLGDVATLCRDSRTARDREVHGRIARERTNELFWIIPVGAIVALGIGLGIDHAGRYFFDKGDLELGTLFLLGLAVLVVGIGLLALAATAATDPISYFSLRRELREFEGERITPRQLSDFRKRLTRIDRRNRSRVLPRRVLSATPNILRLVTIVVGLLVVAATILAQVKAPSAQAGALVFVSILAPVLSAIFAILAIRLSVASNAAWRMVYARQRVDILKMLEEHDRSTRKRTPGLRTRVANALKILGEQQADPPR
jgi:hypothetical protein